MRALQMAGGLAFLSALSPMTADACSKGPFSPLRSPGQSSFMGSATADTALAGAGSVVWAPGRSPARPIYGLVVSVEQLTQHARQMLPSNTTRVVIVPWDYQADCTPVQRVGSSAWIPAGTRGIFAATLRDRKDWANGIPTFDSHQPDVTPYAYGAGYDSRRREMATALSADELFPLLDLMPESRKLQDSADVYAEPLLAWARANRETAARFPIATAVQMVRRAVEAHALKRITSPALGTYRFTVAMPGVPERTFYGRTYDAPASEWGQLGRILPPGTDPTVPRSLFGYHLLMSVAPTMDQLETDCAKDRRLNAEAYMALVNEPGTVSNAGRQFRGMLEVALAARAFPEDETLRPLIRARYGEQGVRGGDPPTPARFVQSGDGVMRVEQVFEYADGPRVELRGERVSNVVVLGCQR